MIKIHWEVLVDDCRMRCPECHRVYPATRTTELRKYSAVRLELPYFMCPPCRTICFDEALLRKYLHEWIKSAEPLRPYPDMDTLKREARTSLKSTIDYLSQTASYRWARFTRIRS